MCLADISLKIMLTRTDIIFARFLSIAKDAIIPTTREREGESV